MPFACTLGVFGGCCGASGTITSSKLSCPTALNVKAKIPTANPAITAPVAMFLKI